MRFRRIGLVVLATAASLLLSTVVAAGIGAPSNDNVANATVIDSTPFTAMQTSEGATTEVDEYSGCNTPGPETVWFSYTADSEGSLLYEVSSADFDPRVWVFKGPADATAAELTPYYSCGESYGIIDLAPGTTYYFRVAAYNWDTPTAGNFTFQANLLDNQDFANAGVLDGLPSYVRGANFIGIDYYVADADARLVPYLMIDDGLEEGEPQPCGAIGFTVWYRLTIDVDATLTANTFDLSNDLGTIVEAADGAARTNFDTVLAVYSGPLGATFDDLVLLGCNDDTGQGVSRVDFPGTSGTTYYFQVGGFNATGFPILSDALAIGPAGMFDLTISALCRNRPATIVGTNGDDTLNGTAEADVIAGLGGIDTINGLRGRDVLCGGPGSDVLSGGTGNDRLIGNQGDDTLLGGPGKDRIWGGWGADFANGGRHTDRCAAETTTACEA